MNAADFSRFFPIKFSFYDENKGAHEFPLSELYTYSYFNVLTLVYFFISTTLFLISAKTIFSIFHTSY